MATTSSPVVSESLAGHEHFGGNSTKVPRREPCTSTRFARRHGRLAGRASAGARVEAEPGERSKRDSCDEIRIFRGGAGHTPGPTCRNPATR